MSRYDDILARLRAATGPDRGIDETIFEWRHGRKRVISSLEEYSPSENLPKLTRSIDDALALVEERLPGWTHQLFTDPLLAPFGARCRLGSAERTRGGCGWPKYNSESHTSTEPLAILIALFEALKAKEE